MKEYITIKNFGPLKDIENIEIKQFTFLIGESASGKSTLMKVVSMMRYFCKMANIRSFLKHSKITKSPFRMRLTSMMEKQGLAKMFTKESVICYCVWVDEDTSYAIDIKDGKLVLPNIASEHLRFSKVSFVSENRNIIPLWTQRAWKNKGATLGFYFHETNDDFGSASEGDKEIRLDYVGMKMAITHPKGKPTKYQIIPTDDRHSAIELTDASSGIQTSAPLVLITNYFAKDFSFKDAFSRSVMSYLYEMDDLSKFKAVAEPTSLPKDVYIHVEEPELCLFPDAQCLLVESLLFTALNANKDRSLHLMVATHSPYILNYLNVVLNQNKEGRAALEEKDMAVYGIHDGVTMNLLMKDEHGKNVVDTFDLTEKMSDILNEYIALIHD